MERLQVNAQAHSVSVIGERTVGREDESFHILLSRVALPISPWVFGRGHESQHEILNVAYKQICNVGNSFDAVDKRFSASVVHLKCRIRTPSPGHTATQSRIRPISSLPPEHTPLLP